jgi:hypothetical protein
MICSVFSCPVISLPGEISTCAFGQKIMCSMHDRLLYTERCWITSQKYQTRNRPSFNIYFLGSGVHSKNSFVLAFIQYTSTVAYIYIGSTKWSGCFMMSSIICAIWCGYDRYVLLTTKVKSIVKRFLVHSRYWSLTMIWYHNVEVPCFLEKVYKQLRDQCV